MWSGESDTDARRRPAHANWETAAPADAELPTYELDQRTRGGSDPWHLHRPPSDGDGDGASEDSHSDGSEAADRLHTAAGESLSAAAVSASSSSSVGALTARTAARRLRTAMRNTTAALRKELAAAHTTNPGKGKGVDELPPPLPLMERNRGEFAGRPPKTNFGDAVPCCRTPTHILVNAPPEPLMNHMAPEHRAMLIAKLKQYDLERNDPNVPLSPLFLNRVVYDCTTAATFSQRWATGKVIGADGKTTRCQCINCTMYSQPAAGTSAHHYGLGGAPSAPATLARAGGESSSAPSACKGEWVTEVRAFYTPTAPSDSTLVFESRFESGNLRTAFQVSEQEYDLTIRPDPRTSHHTQWYYFSVANTRKNKVYKFNLINFVKPASLYNNGMQPLLYSQRAAHEKEPKGWHRGGSNICYYQNQSPRGSSRQKFYYTLSFTIEFQYDHDVVYFAYCYPYTYTSLNRDLHYLCTDPIRSKCLKRRVLCRTLAGNDVDLLTITNFETSSEEEIRARRGIVYTARVHPGESNSSWIMRGCLDFLTSQDPIACALRDRFVFKVVPMLNVDGVAHGAYRCGLAGVDLNRQWKHPSPTLHPTIFATKQMILRMAAVRPILMCVDLHGHSRKMNVFVYGCPNPNTAPNHPLAAHAGDSPMLTSTPTKGKKTKAAKEKERREEEANSGVRLMERVFPRMMAEPLLQPSAPPPLHGTSSGSAASESSSPSSVGPVELLSPSASASPLDRIQRVATSFHLRDCSFHISRGKDATARVVLWRELGLMNSFTLEASFAGASVGQLKGFQFNAGHYENMGRSMVATLWPYLDPELHEQARLSLCSTVPFSSSVADDAEGGQGLDDSDDSSDSPDEVGLPLTIGRQEAEKERGKKKARKQKMKKGATRTGAATAQPASAHASPTAGSPADGSPISSSPTTTTKGKAASRAKDQRDVAVQPPSAVRAPSSSSLSASTASALAAAEARLLTAKEQVRAERERFSLAWLQAQAEEAAELEAKRKKKKATAAAAAAARKEIREWSGSAAVAPSLVHTATSANGFGILGYYRPPPSVSSSPDAQQAPLIRSTTMPHSVAMILDEEERARQSASGSDSLSNSPALSREPSQDWELAASGAFAPASAAVGRSSVHPSSVSASTRSTRPKSAYPLATASGSRDLLVIESARTRGLDASEREQRERPTKRAELLGEGRRPSLTSLSGSEEPMSSLAQTVANSNAAYPPRHQQQQHHHHHQQQQQQQPQQPSPRTARHRDAHARAAAAAAILAASTPTNLYSTSGAHMYSSAAHASALATTAAAASAVAAAGSVPAAVSSATAEEIYNRSHAPDPLLPRGDRSRDAPVATAEEIYNRSRAPDPLLPRGERPRDRDAEQERIDRLLALTTATISGHTHHQAGAWYGTTGVPSSSSATSAMPKARPHPSSNAWTRSGQVAASGANASGPRGANGSSAVSQGSSFSITGLGASSSPICPPHPSAPSLTQLLLGPSASASTSNARLAPGGSASSAAIRLKYAGAPPNGLTSRGGSLMGRSESPPPLPPPDRSIGGYAMQAAVRARLPPGHGSNGSTMGRPPSASSAHIALPTNSAYARPRSAAHF